MTAMAEKFRLDNLAGVSCNEKRKSLFKLLNQNSYSREKIDTIVGGLAPATPLEKIFYVEILLHFRHFDGLFKVFVSGEGLMASKIAKQNWFFDEIFGDASPEHFVETILPALPSSIRLKVLHRLRPDEQRSDQIFDLIVKKYGLFVATNILDRCSLPKIRQIINNFPLNLRVNQLKVMYEREASLVEMYFDRRISDKGNQDFINQYSSLLKHIAEKNPDLFCKLLGKYSGITAKLGKRATKQFVAAKRDEILKEPERLMKVLNSSSMVRKLGVDFAHVYMKLARKLKEFELADVLKHFAKNGQFSLYRKTHDQIYCRKFGEKLEGIEEKLLELMRDSNEREQLAKLKYAEGEDETYLKFYRADTCFEILNAKLDLAQMSQRPSFVTIMLNCCLLNEDLDVLLKLAKLVAGRLKNDDRKVHREFLSTLEWNLDLVKKFNELHWEPVLEICAILDANDECNWTTKPVKRKYLEYLFTNGKPITEMLLKFKLDDPGYFDEGHLPTNPKFHKAYLQALVEDARFDGDEEERNNFYCMIIDGMRRYNNKNRKDQIDVFEFPRLIESARNYVEKKTESSYDYMMYDVLGFIAGVRNSSKTKIDDAFLQTYFGKFNIVGSASSLLWFLCHHPSLIQKHFQEILKIFDKVEYSDIYQSEQLWKMLRKYSHLKLGECVVKFSLKKLNEEDCKHKMCLIKMLSFLMPPEEFIDLAKHYKPNASKIDLKDEKMVDLLKVQTELLTALKTIRKPELVLPVVQQFCTGDYLKTALGPLYSSITRIPQEHAKLYIEQLSSAKAMSVKKHAFYLAVDVLDREAALQYLKTSNFPWLVLVILKYFVKNPNAELWELLKNNMLAVQEKDTGVFATALDVRPPTEYRTESVDLMWNILSKHQNKKLIKCLFANIKENDVKVMNVDFFTKALNDNFLKNDEVNELTVNFLLFHPDNSKFDIVLNALKADGKNKDTKKKFKKLIRSVYDCYMISDDVAEDFVKKFANKFQFKPLDAFEEYVLVQLMGVKGFDDISSEIIKLNHSLFELFGEHVLDLFGKVLKSSLSYFHKTDADRLKFCRGILERRKIVEDALLAIQMLPVTVNDEIESKAHLNKCLDLLREIPKDIVKLKLNFYISQMKTE